MSLFATGARVWVLRSGLAWIVVIAGAATVLGQVPAVVRVEEDWEMVVGSPHPNSNAPQAATVISPWGHVDSIYATFVLNHQSLLSYEPGGLQLQVWDGDVPCSDRMFPNPSVMNQPGEVVRWTQSMELRDGSLLFEITNGSSSTWGNFGGQGYLKATVPADCVNLNAYDPAVSVANSGISYAANRVQSLTLKAVRLITSDHEQLEDTTPRVVYAQ